MSAHMDIHSFTMWLATGERGASSNCIVSTLTGMKIGDSMFPDSDPADPADFRRCELLLRAVPAARQHLHRLREVSPQWAALVDAWDELVALLEEEVPGVFDGKWVAGSAPRTYDRMQELRGMRRR